MNYPQKGSSRETNMVKKGKVYFKDMFAGIITETENGYAFYYDENYINDSGAKALSQTMPLRKEPYESSTLLPFFDGLIPEGWLLDIAENTWKIKPNDRMGLLLNFCQNCIGAVSIIKDETEQIK
jgi:serine/threonine-protein kinase HipA